METTVTLAVPVKDELARLQRQLRAERGRPVTYNEVVEYLLQAREELVKILTAAAEQGA